MVAFGAVVSLAGFTLSAYGPNIYYTIIGYGVIAGEFLEFIYFLDLSEVKYLLDLQRMQILVVEMLPQTMDNVMKNDCTLVFKRNMSVYHSRNRGIVF